MLSCVYYSRAGHANKFFALRHRQRHNVFGITQKTLKKISLRCGQGVATKYIATNNFFGSKKYVALLRQLLYVLFGKLNKYSNIKTYQREFHLDSCVVETTDAHD